MRRIRAFILWISVRLLWKTTVIWGNLDSTPHRAGRRINLYLAQKPSAMPIYGGWAFWARERRG